jgi:acyl-CoA synthetase (AMP-forming)/AMP-acid ligase II
VTADRPQLLHDLLRGPAAAGGRLAAVAPDGGSVTFGELDRRTAALAGWLDDQGERGDRIAVVADNGLAYLQLYYAVPRAGQILALVNQRLSPAEQAAVIAASEPRILVGDARYLDALPAIREQVPSLQAVVSFGSPRWQEALLHHPLAGTRTDLGTGEASSGDLASPDDPGAPAWLAFTSGSTGTPKGVIHTHRSLLAAARGSVEGRQVPEHGVYLFPFPMCHISGYNLLVQHATGSAVVLASRFRPDEFVATVNAHGVTSCSLAPTMLHALLAQLDDADREAPGNGAADSGNNAASAMPTLRAINYGSAAIAADLIDRATRRLNVDFHQGYGMTETGGNVTFLGPAGHRAGAAGDPGILRTAGRPHSQVEIAVVDEHGDPVAPGQAQAGEVVVRGDQVMSGYWRAADATRDAMIEGGWFRTGDIGRVDGQGRLVIVDRAKDVIITGGENVSSREVEDALSTHPGVDLVAVVGVPDPYWGEAICAVVVPLPGHSVAADDLIAHARARISAFKRPRHVVVTGALPLTPNGKIAKDRVRAFARAETGRNT